MLGKVYTCRSIKDKARGDALENEDCQQCLAGQGRPTEYRRVGRVEMLMDVSIPYIKLKLH
jgi:hypothetical protein